MVSNSIHCIFVLADVTDVTHCQCGQLDKYHNPVSNCKTWFASLPPLCFLKGGLSARYCPGARKLQGTDTYLTSDDSICNANKGKYSCLTTSMFYK